MEIFHSQVAFVYDNQEIKPDLHQLAREITDGGQTSSWEYATTKYGDIWNLNDH